MRWRPRCSRSKSVVAVSLGLGREPTEGSRLFDSAGKRSVRQKDPYYTVEDGWVVRRIGPHCERIELAQFPKRGDERLILRDMGRETANLHSATPDQRTKILRDLSERKADWLVNAAHAMSKATEQDWKAFRSSPLAPQS